eukprot:2278846-Alexandrium_andersonii.AAC.1
MRTSSSDNTLRASDSFAKWGRVQPAPPESAPPGPPGRRAPAREASDEEPASQPVASSLGARGCLW